MVTTKMISLSICITVTCIYRDIRYNYIFVTSTVSLDSHDMRFVNTIKNCQLQIQLYNRIESDFCYIVIHRSN